MKLIFYFLTLTGLLCMPVPKNLDCIINFNFIYPNMYV